MISLIVLTYRQGGIDILADSLAQTQPGKEPWELIFIDDSPGRVQRGTAERYLKDRGLPLGYYGHSKTKSYPDTKGGLCNAANTALMHARGDYCIWLSDYSILPPYWLRQWDILRPAQQPRSLLVGCAVEFHTPPPDALGDTTTWKVGTPPLIPKKPWVPWELETFYYGADTRFFEEINGLDERADHCHCWPVSSTLAQVKQLSYNIDINQELCCFMIDHRAWDFDCKIPAPAGCGGEGLWRITHAQSTLEEPKWTVPSPNPFDLVKIREFHGVRGK